MKVIIPLAGKGTRLRPHTHITPKPMLKIAGKPVIDYVLEDLQQLGDVEQVIYITGHLKEKVEEYARAKYPFDSGVHRAEGAGRDGGRGGAGARVRRPAGAHHLRRHDLRRGPLGREAHGRRRHHLGEGGRGLSALRRGGHATTTAT